jgi:hypothetical protein
MLIDIDSEKARERFSPGENQPSEEANQFDQAHEGELGPLFQKWRTFSPTQVGQNSNYTDYLVLDR